MSLSPDHHPALENAGTRLAEESRMALGSFQHLAGDTAVGWSGGSDPGSEISALAVQAMKERGACSYAARPARRHHPDALNHEARSCT